MKTLHQFIMKKDGLAMDAIGEGEPLLLMPYPHASTTQPMSETRLAELLVSLGRQVVTFDPPRSFLSTRPMTGNMKEMLACTLKLLETFQIDKPIDLIGHSMGGLCSLGFALEYPYRVNKLALVNSLSGFPAVLRWSIPHNWCWWKDREYWKSIWYGTLLFTGLGNLETHRRLDNLVEMASFANKSLVETFSILPQDHLRPMPPRSLWARNVRKVNYLSRLSQVNSPTLVTAGRFDPQTPLPCAMELSNGIPNSQLVIFEESGHAPFLEEPKKFTEIIGCFFKSNHGGIQNDTAE